MALKCSFTHTSMFSPVNINSAQLVTELSGLSSTHWYCMWNILGSTVCPVIKLSETVSHPAPPRWNHFRLCLDYRFRDLFLLIILFSALLPLLTFPSSLHSSSLYSPPSLWVNSVWLVGYCILPSNTLHTAIHAEYTHAHRGMFVEETLIVDPLDWLKQLFFLFLFLANNHLHVSYMWPTPEKDMCTQIFSKIIHLSESEFFSFIGGLKIKLKPPS